MEESHGDTENHSPPPFPPPPPLLKNKKKSKRKERAQVGEDMGKGKKKKQNE